MALKMMIDGNKIALTVTTPKDGPTSTASPKPQTLQDVLGELKGTSNYGLLQSASGHFSQFLKQPFEQIPLDALNLKAPFAKYLRERKFSKNSINAYSWAVGMLLRQAQQLGWLPVSILDPKLDAKWKEVRDALSNKRWHALIRYATQLGKAPAELTDSDLNAWGQQLLDEGRSMTYVDWAKCGFRSILVKSGLTAKFPGITFAKERYGIPSKALPPKLHWDLDELLEFKTAEYMEGRPQRARIRKPTALRLQSTITRLYGFAVNIQKRTDIATLPELVTRQCVVSFIKWSLNERKLKGTPLRANFRLLYAALRQNPTYKDHDFSWFRSVISEIPIEPESERRERKESKYVPYEILQTIPTRMREAAVKQGLDNKGLALVEHDALCFSFLLRLGWRQRNIRECRLKHNIFRAKIPATGGVGLHQWVKDKLKMNPNEEFWQFHFRESETKTHKEVRSIVPHQLVPKLEEYLQKHRPILLRDCDPGTLFLNRRGGPLRQDQVVSLVSRITLKYTKTRVTPHIIRDILAYWWLENHPQDYYMLSKLLWHSDIKTTLQIYGARFDESHALCHLEEWLDRP